ncbi:MAG TPA: winged helix-turn-helix domain-containing protein [Candidatus Lokiarchaeia archaeon]|nr:winged helix-turn-helix domain-containing protein [Candidatus Lokiarchaeia archaeon]
MPPRQQGYKFSNWNAKNMKYHIQEQCGKLVSIRTVVRTFHREGLTLQRPRPTRAKGDPEKQQAFLDDLRERIQHAGPRDRYFFFDAASVQRSATVTRMWAEKGKQPQVKVFQDFSSVFPP